MWSCPLSHYKHIFCCADVRVSNTIGHTISMVELRVYRQFQKLRTYSQVLERLCDVNETMPSSHIHNYIRTYVHTYINTYIHTCVRTYIHTNVHTCIHSQYNSTRYLVMACVTGLPTEPYKTPDINNFNSLHSITVDIILPVNSRVDLYNRIFLSFLYTGPRKQIHQRTRDMKLYF